jgi:hypothetical protein
VGLPAGARERNPSQTHVQEQVPRVGTAFALTRCTMTFTTRLNTSALSPSLVVPLAALALTGACEFADPYDLDHGSADVLGGRIETGYTAMGYLTSKWGGASPELYSFCGATLIHPRVAVTAAHCVYTDGGFESTPRAFFDQAYFGLGQVPPLADRVEAWQDHNRPNEYKIQEIVIHPQYRGDRVDDPSDIALLFLDREVPGVAPAALGHAPPSFECARGDSGSLRAVGYGRERPGDNIEEFDPPQNRKSHALCALGLSAGEREIKLQSLDGGTCRGDSGGGLFVSDASVDGRDVLVGVASRLTSTRCDLHNEVYFIYLPGHAPWLAQTLRARLGTSFCREGDLCDLSLSWVERDVRALVALGIVSGLGDGTFGPDRPLTRAQFAVLLSHAFFDLPIVRPEVPAFRDGAEIPSWAYEHVVAAYQRGLLSGDHRGYFLPQDQLTRVQALVAIASGLGWTGQPAQLARFVDGGQVPDWAVSQVAGAAARDVPTSYRADRLRPNDPATRGEAAAFLARALRAR